MASRKHQKAAEKRESGSYVAVTSYFLRSQTVCGLSAAACKLLLDFLSQYRGNNNGDLCAAWKLMKVRGWKSRDTLAKAVRELLAKEIIEKSQQGGKHKPTLYALTMYNVDECNGKIEIAATHHPKSSWKKNEPAGPLCIIKSVTRPACQSTRD
jgi:hypothetical protein